MSKSSFIHDVEIYPEGTNTPELKTLEGSKVKDLDTDTNQIRLAISDTVMYLTIEQAWDLKDFLNKELGHS